MTAERLPPSRVRHAASRLTRALSAGPRRDGTAQGSSDVTRRKERASEGEGISADGPTDIGPASTIAGLDEQELAVLRQAGGHWDKAVGARQTWVRALPIDPGLHRFPSALEPRGGGRFASIDFVETEDSAEIVATPHAGGGPPGRGARHRPGAGRHWVRR